MMLTGLSAFPLTPYADGRVDQTAYAAVVEGLAAAGVDLIGALGSTGSYPYLTREERRICARTAVRAAGDVPVLVGVGAVSTREVLAHVQDAADAGAAAVLLAPVSYQPLTEDEVFGLYEDVASSCPVPVVVYDNPRTTGFTFTPTLHARIAALPNVVSIKLPGVPDDLAAARRHLRDLRGIVPSTVTLGISGDAAGARGLLAGCQVWYSVLAGILPATCLAITRAAQAEQAEHALALAAELDPVWELFARFGSYRVASAMAAERGLVRPEGLHAPVRPLAGADRRAVVAVLEALGEHR